MIKDHETGSLRPFDFDKLVEQIPALKKFDLDIISAQLSRVMDSSNMSPAYWKEMVELIEQNYDSVDGFVILHGTDTMSYTASALSFMMEGLQKPVILTGSQLPIETIRTDGKENLITALEVAAAHHDGRAVVPEVAIYFEYSLMRGNRTTKFSAEHFDAFISPNYPELAVAGVHIDYHDYAIDQDRATPLMFRKTIVDEVGVLKLFPGIRKESVEAILQHSAHRGIVMESFGSGNAPTDKWFIDCLKEAISQGKTILNITQCPSGRVTHGRYETSESLEGIGVVSGQDMTFEAGLTKLMYVLSKADDPQEIKRLLIKDLRGELSPE